VIVVRPTNIFGPGQLPEKFIPLGITNALDGLPIPVYGDGRQRRGWLFVDDFCGALQTIIERGSVGDIYNVAGERECANLETARAILSHLGRLDEGLQCVADRPGHDRRYAMNDAKLRAMGWQPSTPFEQGLSKTVAWYRERRDWWGPLAQHLREDPYHWLNRPSGTGAQQDTRARR
jgi:dTDP-glucose 4,6-dehydratase